MASQRHGFVDPLRRTRYAQTVNPAITSAPIKRTGQGAIGLKVTVIPETPR
jgi:hypothetical protein